MTARWQAETVREALLERAENLFREVWGEPQKAGAAEWRAKGRANAGRTMRMRGGNRGLWSDHKTGGGGSILDLFALEFCGLADAKTDFPRVLTEAAGWCGLTPDTAPDLEKIAERRAQREAEARKADARKADAKAAYVEALGRACQPLEDTPAAVYLARRGLGELPALGLAYLPPDAVRMTHAGRGALIVWGLDANGRALGGQRILVEPDGAPADVDPRKTSFGAIGGHPARFPARVEGGPLVVAEGPESALSAWATTGWETWAVFGVGQFASAPIPKSRDVILCPDRDAPDSPAADTFRRACMRHVEAGCTIRVAAAPEPIGSKRDLNDTLQRAGLDAVRSALEGARPYKPPETRRPAYALPTGDLPSARRTVKEAAARWKANALAWMPSKGAEDYGTPPVEGLRVTTGVGKSHEARESAVELAHALREKGDTRPVVIAVPRHKLGDEYLDALKGRGITVEAYRGRRQEDPEREGERMCPRHAEADEVQRAGGDVDGTLCQQGENQCPLHGLCGTHRQRKKQADLWIVPHALLWRKPPACVGNPAALVVDEDPTSSMFVGFDGPGKRLSLDNLAAPLPNLGSDQNADLTYATGKVADALRTGERMDPRALGLSVADLGAGIVAAWKGKQAPACGPGSTPAQVRAACGKVAAQNKRVRLTARTLEMVKAAAEMGASIVPGLTAGPAEGHDGETYMVARLRWRERIADGWRAPTLCASATMSDALFAAVWPDIGEVVEATAAAPWQSVRQITDRAFGASSLVPKEDALEPTQRYSRNLRGRLQRYIEARHATLGGRTLVVAQKAVLKALGDMPKGVETAHFNALSGLDLWRDVRIVIVIGRTMPAPGDMEARAELLVGDAVEAVDGWYGRAPARLAMRDGSTGPDVFRRGGKGQPTILGRDWHPDPTAEALRWATAEGELLQAIGRGRGALRGPDTPLQVDLLVNVPLPVAVDEAGTFDALEPTPADLLEVRGVRIPDTGAKGAWNIAAAILPDLFSGPDAARKGFGSSRGQNPIENPYIGICPREGWSCVRVRPEGGRYAVDVEVRAGTRAEAEAILAPHRLALTPETPETLPAVPEAALALAAPPVRPPQIWPGLAAPGSTPVANNLAAPPPSASNAVVLFCVWPHVPDDPATIPPPPFIARPPIPSPRATGTDPPR